MEQFSTGAKRSSKKPRYDLIPFEALEAIAERFELGGKIYGDDNWKKGGEDFYLDAKNHAQHHLLCYIHGILEDEKSPVDHLKAAAWNLAVLLWYEAQKQRPSPMDDPYERGFAEGFKKGTLA